MGCFFEEIFVIPAAAGELSEEGEIFTPFFCPFGVPGEYRFRGDKPGRVAGQANAFILFGPLADLFGDVLSNVFCNRFGGGADREQLDTSKPVHGEPSVVHFPEGTQQGIAGFQPAFFSCLVVCDPGKVFFPVEAGADIALALDDDVIVPSSAFLSFAVPDPFTVKGGQIVAVHAVEAPGRFFVAFYVIGEGQGQEGAVLKAVEGTKSLYVAG